MQCYGMLEVGSPTAVLRLCRPFVVGQVEGGRTLGYHWLDGDAESVFQDFAVTLLTIVGHHGVFVHLAAHTVAYKLAHDTISLALCPALNGIAYVAEAMAQTYLLYASIESFLRSA